LIFISVLGHRKATPLSLSSPPLGGEGRERGKPGSRAFGKHKKKIIL